MALPQCEVLQMDQRPVTTVGGDLWSQQGLGPLASGSSLSHLLKLASNVARPAVRWKPLNRMSHHMARPVSFVLAALSHAGAHTHTHTQLDSRRGTAGVFSWWRHEISCRRRCLFFMCVDRLRPFDHEDLITRWLSRSETSCTQSSLQQGGGLGLGRSASVPARRICHASWTRAAGLRRECASLKRSARGKLTVARKILECCEFGFVMFICKNINI